MERKTGMTIRIINVRIYRPEPTQTIVRAVRALRRYFAPIADLHNTACDLDALFDGGEFSAPRHACLLAEAETAAVNYVAKRFGISPLVLEAAWVHADDLQHQLFLQSICPKPRPVHVPEPDDEEPAFEERALRRAARDEVTAYYEQFEDFGRNDWKLGE
jgi:hypothetical protein